MLSASHVLARTCVVLNGESTEWMSQPGGKLAGKLVKSQISNGCADFAQISGPDSAKTPASGALLCSGWREWVGGV